MVDEVRWAHYDRGTDHYSLRLEGWVRRTGSGAGSGDRNNTPWDWRLGSGELGAEQRAGIGSVLPEIGGLGQGNSERGSDQYSLRFGGLGQRNWERSRERGSDQYSLRLEAWIRGTGSGAGSGGQISNPWDWRVGSGEPGAGQGAGVGSVLPEIGGLGQGNRERDRERGSDQYSLRLEGWVRGTGSESGTGSGGRISTP